MEINPSIRPLLMQAGHSSRGRVFRCPGRQNWPEAKDARPGIVIGRRGMTCSHRAGGDNPLRDHPMLTMTEVRDFLAIHSSSVQSPPALNGSTGGILCL